MPTSSDWYFPIGAYTPETKGSILKSKGQFWDGGDYETNESGFSALPGGVIEAKTYYDIGERAYFWEIDEHNLLGDAAYWRVLRGTSSSFSRSQGYKNSGVSVRCWED